MKGRRRIEALVLGRADMTLSLAIKIGRFKTTRRRAGVCGFAPAEMSPMYDPANMSLGRSKTQETYESPFPLPAGGPILTSCVLAAVIGAEPSESEV